MIGLYLFLDAQRTMMGEVIKLSEICINFRSKGVKNICCFSQHRLVLCVYKVVYWSNKRYVRQIIKNDYDEIK